LAFVQGGPLGTRLVLLTSPVIEVVAWADPVPEATQIYLSLWTTAKTHGEFKVPLRLSDARLIRGTRNPSIRPFRIHKDLMGDVRRILSALGLITVEKIGGPQPAKLHVNQLSDEHVAELVFALNRVLRLGLERDLRRVLVNGRKSKEWKTIEGLFRGRTSTAEDLTPGLASRPGGGSTARLEPRPASGSASEFGTAGSDAGDPAYSVEDLIIDDEEGGSRPGSSRDPAVAAAEVVGSDGPPVERAEPAAPDVPHPGQQTGGGHPRHSKPRKTPEPIDLSGLKERDELVSMIRLLFGNDSINTRSDGTVLPSPDDLTPYRTLALLRSGVVRKDWRWTPREGDPIRYLRAYKSWLIVQGVRADGSVIPYLTFLAGRTRRSSPNAIDPKLIDIAVAGYAYRVVLAIVAKKPFLAPAHGAWQRLWNNREPIDMQRRSDRQTNGSAGDRPHRATRTDHAYGRRSSRELDALRGRRADAGATP
jgi:hypothetical protein